MDYGRKMNDIKKRVKEGYGKIALNGSSCCPESSCCGNSAEAISKNVGYTEKDISTVPDGANLGLGCGNPVAIAALKEGDIVLDLGAGAGFDAFLAASKVGKTGKVIGVDMTPEMVARAKENARKGGHANIEFKLGEIESLPINENSIDVVISNCVINLSPDKEKVFKEALRVLKPGGRLMVSDLVLVKDLPDNIRKSVELYIGCIAGAVKKEDYIRYMKIAGFEDIKILDETGYLKEDAVVSVKISAIKPGTHK